MKTEKLAKPSCKHQSCTAECCQIKVRHGGTLRNTGIYCAFYDLAQRQCLIYDRRYLHAACTSAVQAREDGLLPEHCSYAGKGYKCKVEQTNKED